MMLLHGLCNEAKTNFCPTKRKKFHSRVEGHLNLRFTAMVTYSFRLYNLVTSKPEERWFGQPKYCFQIYYVVSALQ